jgi:hypothetical protein
LLERPHCRRKAAGQGPARESKLGWISREKRQRTRKTRKPGKETKKDKKSHGIADQTTIRESKLGLLRKDKAKTGEEQGKARRATVSRTRRRSARASLDGGRK